MGMSEYIKTSLQRGQDIPCFDFLKLEITLQIDKYMPG